MLAILAGGVLLLIFLLDSSDRFRKWFQGLFLGLALLAVGYWLRR
jgi:hypothetical protein